MQRSAFRKPGKKSGLHPASQNWVRMILHHGSGIVKHQRHGREHRIVRIVDSEHHNIDPDSFSHNVAPEPSAQAPRADLIVRREPRAERENPAFPEAFSDRNDFDGYSRRLHLFRLGLCRAALSSRRQPSIGQVTTTSYDPVPQQNGKTQFHFNPPQAQTSGEFTFSAGRMSPGLVSTAPYRAAYGYLTTWLNFFTMVTRASSTACARASRAHPKSSNTVTNQD